MRSGKLKIGDIRGTDGYRFRGYGNKGNELWLNPESYVAWKIKKVKAATASRARRRERDPEYRKTLAGYAKKHRNKDRKAHLIYMAKKRANERNMDFDLTVENVIWNDICPVLGFPIVYNNEGKPQFNSATLDRIDNSKGYTVDNVVVVSFRANIIKRDATPQELRQIADFYERLTKNV